eukprot:TRINITY_DN7465_c0_g1_i4.p1 TRINITY_DN7465_c0_g1~~TRINITY_DN7465_c0_g1_i4.p1  ORF type:complete len:451 (+),score=47.32 TRINITY_DN7465_c0_g1_i4:70-1422(+)
MASSCFFGGEALPGYEKVRDLFVKHFEDGIEECAQLCIFVKGRKVVDLWGAVPDQQTGNPLYGYGPDFLQNVFSSTKVLTSLVVAMLVDRGFLRYDQRVADIWPEFAQQDKGEITIVEVMRHEAGLFEFDEELNTDDLSPSRIRAGSVSAIIARQKPKHTPGKKRTYHAVTRGWVINEIVHRVDPQGRTVGEFLRDEVAGPLGRPRELVIGIEDELMNRVAPLQNRGKCWNMRQSCLPRCLGGGRAAGYESLFGRCNLCCLTSLFCCFLPCMDALKRLCRCCRPSKKPDPLGFVVSGGEDPATAHMMPVCARFNHPETRRCEIPSANGHATARALAEVAAAMVNGGELLTGARLITAKGLADAMGDPDEKTMFGIPFSFTNAGWCEFGNLRRGWVGWMGYGGSVMQWHPETVMGFGYAMNLLEPCFVNARALQLQKAALDCALAQQTGQA